MLNEKSKSNIGLFIINDGEWQPLNKTEENNLKYCDNIKYEPFDEPITLEFENAVVNEEIMSTLNSQNIYDFILDNKIMLRGTIKKEYLLKKWYWRKKGKRYKRFYKHSKEFIMEFEGKVVE